MDKKWKFRNYLVPDYMRDGIEVYVQLGKPPGDFLTAVICNDLKKAVVYADDINIGNLAAFVNYFYNYAPLECWGSEQRFENWIAQGGLIGIRRIKEQQRAKVIREAENL